MSQIHNQKHLESLKKQLRRNLPSPEIKLWQKLRNKQLKGVKFRRQHSINHYIVDFYAPSIRLAIEIDGDSHFTKEKQKKDIARDLSLNKLNIKTLRFTNNQVNTIIEGVLHEITRQL